ncbi:MAG: hypothetical protein ACI96P_000793 [Candidatus Azotimanducaceae bacterium]|jgi:uncharacterized protein (TIGR00255 family)
MTHSMTAFARRESIGISWEIRSVNHRYLDHTFKIPEQFRSLEIALRDLLKQQVSRGKIDCLLRLTSAADLDTSLQINDAQVHRLRNALDEIEQVIGNTAPLNALDILRFPGILDPTPSIDNDALLADAKTLFAAAIDDLIAMRAREGRVLAQIINDKLGDLKQLTAAVRLEAPQISARQKNRLLERLAELQLEVDPSRLDQELIYLAQKSDIVEELDRLDSHVEEIRSTITEPGPKGRRLDFLMQELNREANTLSSKAVAANTSIQAVEIKVVIEQMREQIQNIE